MVYPITVRLEKNERVIELQSWSMAELRAGVAATFDLPPEDTEELSLVCSCFDGRKTFLGNDRDLVRAMNPRETMLVEVHAMYGSASKVRVERRGHIMTTEWEDSQEDCPRRKDIVVQKLIRI